MVQLKKSHMNIFDAILIHFIWLYRVWILSTMNIFYTKVHVIGYRLCQFWNISNNIDAQPFLLVLLKNGPIIMYAK